MPPPWRETLVRYFEALDAQRWDALAACLAEDVHRVGPYRDEIRGRDAYVAFLARVIEKLPGYRLEVDEIHALAAGGAFAEIRETVLRDGAPFVTPEALYFGFDAAGRIARVRVYIQRAA